MFKLNKLLTMLTQLVWNFDLILARNLLAMQRDRFDNSTHSLMFRSTIPKRDERTNRDDLHEHKSLFEGMLRIYQLDITSISREIVVTNLQKH